MTEFTLIINVILMFFLRIGLPLIVLVILGIVVDRWQTRLHQDADAQQEKTYA